MPSQIAVSKEHFKYDYYSGSSVGLFIGGNQITDALGIEFDVMQTKRALYGYASSLYDGVASGVVQASGTIYMNFTQAQQMSTFIANSKGGVEPLSILQRESVDLDFNSSSNMASIEVYAEDLKSRHWGQDRLTDQLEGSNFSIKEDGKWVAHARPDQHLDGFDIVITYGVPFRETEHTRSTMRVIRGVRVVGFGQTVSPDGEPIVERYSFLAREVI